MADITIDPVKAQPISLGDTSAAPSLDIIENEDVEVATAKRFGGIKLGFGGWVALGWLITIALLALFGPWLPIADPNEVANGELNAGPSGNNWLGTDNQGRDLFSRVIFGARVPLLVAFISVSAGLMIGGAIGIFSGYVQGKSDRVAMTMVDLLLAFPAIVLSMALVKLFGERFEPQFGDGAILIALLLAIAIVSIPPLARVARANTMSVREREFVLAAESLGATNSRIVSREILPNVAVSMVSVALLGMALAVVAEGALAFLDLSVKDPAPTWGKMINQGQDQLRTHFLMSAVPIGALFLTVVSLNMLADKARDLVDGRGPS